MHAIQGRPTGRICPSRQLRQLGQTLRFAWGTIWAEGPFQGLVPTPGFLKQFACGTVNNPKAQTDCRGSRVLTCDTEQNLRFAWEKNLGRRALSRLSFYEMVSRPGGSQMARNGLAGVARNGPTGFQIARNGRGSFRMTRNGLGGFLWRRSNGQKIVWEASGWPEMVWEVSEWQTRQEPTNQSQPQPSPSQS